MCNFVEKLAAGEYLENLRQNTWGEVRHHPDTAAYQWNAGFDAGTLDGKLGNRRYYLAESDDSEYIAGYDAGYDRNRGLV